MIGPDVVKQPIQDITYKLRRGHVTMSFIKGFPTHNVWVCLWHGAPFHIRNDKFDNENQVAPAPRPVHDHQQFGIFIEDCVATPERFRFFDGGQSTRIFRSFSPSILRSRTTSSVGTRLGSCHRSCVLKNTRSMNLMGSLWRPSVSTFRWPNLLTRFCETL